MSPLIPDTAPFNPQQRAWLSGFFAGVLGAGQGEGASGSTSTLAPVADEDDHPWHDAALPLGERLALAKGKPLASRLMAAMAQLDCGACGYLCQTYSAAIATGDERDLTRCSPGGNDTAQALRRLVAIEPPAAAKQQPVASSADASKYSRTQPFTAQIASTTRLTHIDAPKDTRHVAIDLLDSGLTYEPGDAIGICPVNCPDLVRGVLGVLGATGDEPVAVEGGSAKPLRDALSHDFTLARARPALLELLAKSASDPQEADQLRELAATEGGPLAGADVCEVLERFPSARPPIGDFVATLQRLQPRLYSISSSQRKHPGQVHATVGVVRFESAGRWRNGVASHFLGVRSSPGDSVRVFVQPSHRFRLPADPATPIIMVGPGTGIAPFISFLQERAATSATGQNWLIFGNQYFDLDFLYRESLDQWSATGLLTRLDVAFSRDTAEKVYVQQRMLEQGGQLWSWLAAGAYFYVCGDARRMAPDVDADLKQIAADHGSLSPDEATAYVARLAKEKRYLKDVY
ncbi:MAG: sulfite reductase subunit alpha [Pirellulaceae bacterium]